VSERKKGKKKKQIAMAAVSALLAIAFLAGAALATDPYAYFDWDVSYITTSPLGVPQKVLLLLHSAASRLKIRTNHYPNLGFCAKDFIFIPTASSSSTHLFSLLIHCLHRAVRDLKLAWMCSSLHLARCQG
jgi:hypothetical protein